MSDIGILCQLGPHARPKRLTASHAAFGEHSALLLANAGPDGMRSLLPFLSDASPAPATWPRLELFTPPTTHQLPASAPTMAAPRAEATSSNYESATDARQVTLHLGGTSPKLQLAIPAPALLGWSISPKLPTSPPLEGKYLINLEGVPTTGVDLQLTLRGWQPVEIDLRGIDGARAASPEVRALEKRLPDWVNLTAYAYRIARVKI